MKTIRFKNEFILGIKYSESKTIYNETNQLAEKLSKIIYLVIVKISIPCLVLPKIIVCFIAYYATDSGNDAFELPLPMWYVSLPSMK